MAIKMKLIDLVEAYEYGTRKYLAYKKEEIQCSNIIKLHKKWLSFMMFLIKEERKEHHPNW